MQRARQGDMAARREGFKGMSRSGASWQSEVMFLIIEPKDSSECSGYCQSTMKTDSASVFELRTYNLSN